MNCFDKYIKSAHLMKSRSVLCPPGEDKVKCFDRYISDMKIKPSFGKREMKRCGTTNANLECLDRTIEAIKQKDVDYLKSRGVQCEPGSDEIGCFDQYVQQLQLKQPKGKRQQISCGPGEDSISCFDRHVSNLKLIRRQESKRAKDFHCGFNEDDLSCFDRYITEVKLLPMVSVHKRSVYGSGLWPRR